MTCFWVLNELSLNVQFSVFQKNKRFCNDQQSNILFLDRIPDLLDYEQSLFPLRDSQRKWTSERTQ